MMAIRIRQFEPDDWQKVAKIYREGIETGIATFETEVPDYATWRKKFDQRLLWVAEINNEVVAWAGLQPVSMRIAYRGVMEVTIYVQLDQARKGIGKTLMNHLILESEKAGIWTLHSSVFEQNVASIVLHETSGFRRIGYREKIAQWNGQWHNTILFEKRSKKVGV